MLGHLTQFRVGTGAGSGEEQKGLLGGYFVAFHQDPFRLADVFWESANATAAWAATTSPIRPNVESVRPDTEQVQRTQPIASTNNWMESMLKVVDGSVRRMQDGPSALGDRDAKLNVRALPAWKQDYNDVGTYHCISLMLPDGAQITEGDGTRIPRSGSSRRC